jgi:pimeloyl-ACP methyl ester carboxylesterase
MSDTTFDFSLTRARPPRVACQSCLLVVAIVLSVSPAYAQIASSEPSRRVAAVFAADGAGNFQAASNVLGKVVAEDGLPLEVIAFEWSHGYLRILSDQMSFDHMREQGRWLAEAVLSHRRENPDTPIMLYGHSAGCMVVAAALETLPAGVVDRAVFLSPSLSSRYDLRPALAKVKRGLHVFYSRRDWCYLGMTTWLVGTSDRRHDYCSGRVGFDIEMSQLEPDLAAKFLQRSWQPEDRALGHNGGHYGFYQPDFLRAYVVPLLLAKEKDD